MGVNADGHHVHPGHSRQLLFAEKPSQIGNYTYPKSRVHEGIDTPVPIRHKCSLPMPINVYDLHFSILELFDQVIDVTQIQVATNIPWKTDRAIRTSQVAAGCELQIYMAGHAAP